MTVNIRDLQLFYHAVEERSFTSGAEKAGVSQTTVTRAVERLEELAGAKLIIRERGTDLFELTPKGKKLYLKWQGIGANIQSVTPHVFSDYEAPEIQLSGPITLLSEILLVSNPFGPLSGIQPNINTKLTICEPETFSEVGQSQILFTYSPEILPQRNDLMIKKVCTLRLGLYGDKRYLKSTQSNENRIYFCLDDDLSAKYAPMFGGAVVVSNGILIRDALLTGRGIGLAGTYCEPYRPDLERINSDVDISLPIYMVFQKDIRMVPGAPILIEALDHIFKLVIEIGAISKGEVVSGNFLTAV